MKSLQHSSAFLLIKESFISTTMPRPTCLMFLLLLLLSTLHRPCWMCSSKVSLGLILKSLLFTVKHQIPDSLWNHFLSMRKTEMGETESSFRIQVWKKRDSFTVNEVYVLCCLNEHCLLPLQRNSTSGGNGLSRFSFYFNGHLLKRSAYLVV